MAGERGKRIYRKATNAEKQRHSRVREQIANELPEIKQRARDRLSSVVAGGTRFNSAGSVYGFYYARIADPCYG